MKKLRWPRTSTRRRSAIDLVISAGRTTSHRTLWRDADRLQEPTWSTRGAAMVFGSLGASGLPTHQRGLGHQRRPSEPHLRRHWTAAVVMAPGTGSTLQWLCGGCRGLSVHWATTVVDLPGQPGLGDPRRPRRCRRSKTTDQVQGMPETVSYGSLDHRRRPGRNPTTHYREPHRCVTRRPQRCVNLRHAVSQPPRAVSRSSSWRWLTASVLPRRLSAAT
jgi:hypothetical protein